MRSLEERRAWFREYLSTIENLDSTVYNDIICPCCGFPTLGHQSSYEMCVICSWEDDGQDDEHAEEVWGGPNGDYSLREARENFTNYLTMFRPEDEYDDFTRDTTPHKISIKKKIITLFHNEPPAHKPELMQVYRILLREINRTTIKLIPGFAKSLAKQFTISAEHIAYMMAESDDITVCKADLIESTIHPPALDIRRNRNLIDIVSRTFKSLMHKYPGYMMTKAELVFIYSLEVKKVTVTITADTGKSWSGSIEYTLFGADWSTT